MTRVLLVGDDDHHREILERHLRREPGVTVVASARDAVDAVVMAGTLRPDAIILEDELPRTRGLDIVLDLRSAAPAARIVVWSAEQLREEALERGAHVFVPKSGNLTPLVDALQP